MYKKLEKCLKSIRKKTDFKPEKAVILGSGLGDYAEKIQIEKIVKYTDIEDFPVSTVQGHKGQFVFGYVKDVPVVLMQGRVHYYEGYSMQDVVLPTRLMGMMGAKKILLTNAAGGVNPSFRPGDFMLITDHITTAVPSPLIGPNIEELGTRFPDMSEVYSKNLQKIIRKSAKDCGIPLQEGVYVQLTGPNYETPAEIRMVRSWGADAVGMSTACEAMAARHMGMEVCGISCILCHCLFMLQRHARIRRLFSLSMHLPDTPSHGQQYQDRSRQYGNDFLYALPADSMSHNAPPFLFHLNVAVFLYPHSILM